MARAYRQLVERAELEQSGELPPGKVTRMLEEANRRDDTQYGGHGSKPHS